MKIIFYYLLAVLATYVGVAYVVAESNPLLWEGAARFTHLVMALACCFLITGIYFFV